MTIEVAILDLGDLDLYDRFVERCSTSLVYHTSTYLRFLKEIARDTELIISIARRGDLIVAALPCFLKSSEGGVVLNSLPYYGSHGDVLVADDEINSVEVVSKVVEFLIAICRRKNVGAINIVSHPISPRVSIVATSNGLQNWAERIGQISILPFANTPDVAGAAILNACSPKTRNLVRKGLRGNFTIYQSDADRDWRLLAQHHGIGMNRIGGTAKSAEQFLALRDGFSSQRICSLYVAYRGSELAGALLNLRYREWIEYFTPVAVEKFRSEQVLSALIFAAMSDAVMAGARYWNWGGTWPSQRGVYHFKKGWGAEDRRYEYFGAVWDSRLAAMEPSALLSAFPFFFVRPFDERSAPTP